MSTLCAEPQFPAQATSTQHWQKQEDALAASLVFEDSGFSCGVCVCVCERERERWPAASGTRCRRKLLGARGLAAYI
jgi:hypothetical protein